MADMLSHLENMFGEVRNYMLTQGYKSLGILGANVKGSDVTAKFDLESENVAINYCKKHGLPVQIWTEEQGIVDVSRDPKYIFIFDPCDGSTNFKNGIEGSAFSAACVPFSKEGIANPKDVVYALIGSVVSGSVLKGSKGKGVTYKGPFNGFKKTVAHTSKNSNIQAARIEIDLDFGLNEAAGVTTEKTKMKRIHRLITTGIKNIRRNGSAAMGLSYVPTGAVNAYVDVRDLSTPENWMAAYLLVREAGGVFTDPFGNDIGEVDNMTKPYNYVASGNKKIHRTILERLDME
ncbi:hypothetical protein HYZ41_02150 [archaeon]|nr:hypothetical protein [archaeon]